MVSIRAVEKQVMRALGLSPTRRALRGLKRHGLDTSRMRALDMFAGNGTQQVLCYSAAVQSLEAWELDPDLAQQLKRNVAKAVVRAVDSYRQLAVCESKFDLIFIDAPTYIYGPGNKYCEHLMLFPGVLSLCSDEAVLLLTVAPELALVRHDVGCPDRVGTPRHLEQWAVFYHTQMPERVPLGDMARAYAEHCAESGFELQWWFAVPRRYVHTMVLKLHKQADKQPA